MSCPYSRRRWLSGAAAGLAGAYLARAIEAPASTVAIARCRTYSPNELLPVMTKVFDRLGGLGKLVKGKTVAVKINLTGAPTYRVGYLRAEDTHYTHPQVIAAAAHLMAKAGARRIRILESPWTTADRLQPPPSRAAGSPHKYWRELGGLLALPG